jgi:hypothetical protein
MLVYVYISLCYLLLLTVELYYIYHFPNSVQNFKVFEIVKGLIIT